MALGEFELIARYFARLTAQRPDAGVVVGIGDDAAVLSVPAGDTLVAAVDTIVESVHFHAGARAADIGYRVLAVNLSDMAAMGAVPRWYTLALTLPAVDEAWLAGFCDGLQAAGEQFGVELVGGDTTRGPLAATVQILGLAEGGRCLRRAGASPGEALFATGTLGDAAGGLQLQASPASPEERFLEQRFLRPVARIGAGLALSGVAGGCIDVSDGLLADAGHIAEASGVGIEIDYARLPVSPALVAVVGEARARELALTGGDDYELCFSAPPAAEQALQQRFAGLGLRLTRIGRIVDGGGVRCVDSDGKAVAVGTDSWDHFRR